MCSGPYLAGREAPVTCIVPFTSHSDGPTPALRIAVLAPIAWRTPPRTTGRGSCSPRSSPMGWSHWDTTSRCSLPPTCFFYDGQLHSTVPCRWSEDEHRPEGRRVRAHRLGLRACRRLRRHPQRFRLPAVDIQRADRHSVVSMVSSYTSCLCTRYDATQRHQTSRSATPTGTGLLVRATIHHGIDVDAFAVHSDPGEHLLFFGRIHPDKGTASAIEVAARTGRRLVIAGIVQDEHYFGRDRATRRWRAGHVRPAGRR